MPRIIRKYGNRRLYDTSTRRYVNLDEIASAVRAGDDIQVVDAKTGEDLTRGVLTQIIVDEAKNTQGGLPLDVLRQLISLSDKARSDLLSWYVHTALDVYHKAQQAPLDWMRSFLTPHSGAPPSGENRDMDELRRRIEELERQLGARR